MEEADKKTKSFSFEKLSDYEKVLTNGIKSEKYLCIIDGSDKVFLSLKDSHTNEKPQDALICVYCRTGRLILSGNQNSYCPLEYSESSVLPDYIRPKTEIFIGDQNETVEAFLKDVSEEQKKQQFLHIIDSYIKGGKEERINMKKYIGH